MTRPTLATIRRATAKAFGVTDADLLGPRRDADLCRARFAAMLAMRQIRRSSSQRIADAIGRECHTTVVHGVRRGREMLARDREFGELVTAAMLRAGR